LRFCPFNKLISSLTLPKLVYSIHPKTSSSSIVAFLLENIDGTGQSRSGEMDGTENEETLKESE
jgi:hypothetical protein